MRKKRLLVIKYPNRLHGLQSYDLINGVAIVCRYGDMLGVVKLLLKLWFWNEHKQENMFHDKLTLFNEHLTNTNQQSKTPMIK